MRRSLFGLVFAIATSYPFGAFGIGTDEPNNPTLVIAYTISIPQPQTHLFHVEIDIRGVEEKTIALSMPVWSTGYYHIDDFAGYVTEFDARDASGKELDWAKSDKNTWAIETRGGEALKIKYKVYARDPFIVHSFVNARAGHILSSGLLISLDLDKNAPVSLALELPEGWKVSNGAIPRGEDPFRFDFPSYHELVDTPMLIGTHKVYTYEVAGIPHVVAIEGESDLDHQAFVEGTRKLAEAARGLFGGLPYQKYCFILFLGPGMGGGLEHLNGTTMGARPWGFSQDPMRLEQLLDLTSHEYFHTWNVKRIQPDVFKPYDYDRETETGFLWFSEGVTEYYTDQLLVRAGIYTPEIVLRNLAELIGETRSTPGRLYQSAFESSFDTWIAPRNENRANATISYYPKGEIAGLVIDFEIMKRTQAEKSFDEVLLEMWKAYQEEDAGFDTEEIRVLCEKTTGGSFEQIFNDYVYGVKEVPFEEILKIAGYELITDEERVTKEQKGGYLGARYSEQEGKVKVTSILRDTEVWRDGLNFDDEIIALNGIRIDSVTDLDYQLQIRKPGDEVRFLVGRSGWVDEIQVTLEEYPVPIYKIVDVERPTDLQLKIRKTWFKQ